MECGATYLSSLAIHSEAVRTVSKRLFQGSGVLYHTGLIAFWFSQLLIWQKSSDEDKCLLSSPVIAAPNPPTIYDEIATILPS